jgi:hypothetical protein
MFLLGIIIKEGIDLLSAEMFLITVKESWFFGTLMYISLILSGTTTLFLVRQAIQHLILSILYIFFFTPYACVFERWLIFLFKLITKLFFGMNINTVACNRFGFNCVKFASIFFFFSYIWNYCYNSAGLFSYIRSYIAQLYIICFIASLPLFIA